MATLLKRGSKGAAVRELQELLNRLSHWPGKLVVDGDFGAATESAVRTLQGMHGLVIDGIAGPQTLAALKAAATPAKSGKPEPDKSAMTQPAPVAGVAGTRAAPPPNVAALKLLDTARAIDTLWVHCSATAEGKDYTVADIRAWHKQRGWSDIGYHYVVYRDGSIHVGRPVGQVGSHVAGHNTGSIGIVYVGGVSVDGKTAKDTRTPAQRASLLWLAQRLVAKHGIKRVRGHNEVAAKACPSFDVRKDALGKVA